MKEYELFQTILLILKNPIQANLDLRKTLQRPVSTEPMSAHWLHCHRSDERTSDEGACEGNSPVERDVRRGGWQSSEKFTREGEGVAG